MTPAPVAPPQPAPVGIPLLAAAIALLGPVIGFVVFIMQVGGAPESEYGDSSTTAGLASAWNEGGWPMYAAFAASMFLAFFSALFVFFAARRSAALAIGLPLFAVIPAAIGGAGTNWGLQGAMTAVAHVSPADRVTILCAALKEALWTTTFGASLSAGACVTLALALIIASRAQQKDTHRQALTLGGLLFGGFSALAIVGAITSRAVGDAYGLIAYASHSFMIDGMLELVLGFQRWQGFTAGVALALGIVILVATAMLKAPAAGRGAFLLAAMFSALLLFVSVRSKVSEAFVEAVSAPSNFGGERFKFDAPEARDGAGTDVDESFDAEAATRLTSNLRATRELHDAAGDKLEDVALTLRPGVKAEGLALALHAVAMERFRAVTLLTDPTNPAPSVLPPPFSFVSIMSHGLKVKLAFRDDSCGEECELATLNADALVVGAENWPLEKSATTQQDGEPLYLAVAPIEPSQLLAAIATASKHQRSLTLLFESSVFDGDGDLAGPIPPPPPPPPPKKKK